MGCICIYIAVTPVSSQKILRKVNKMSITATGSGRTRTYRDGDTLIRLSPNHSGSCCGIKHIYKFETSWLSRNKTASEIVDSIKQLCKRAVANESYDRGETYGTYLYEIVLTSAQLGSPLIKEVLNKLGFKKVNSFENRNSGNTCHIFHATELDK